MLPGSFPVPKSCLTFLRHAFFGDHDMQRLRQLTFASLEYDRKKRHEIFLERMDGLIPWA